MTSVFSSCSKVCRFKYTKSTFILQKQSFLACQVIHVSIAVVYRAVVPQV